MFTCTATVLVAAPVVRPFRTQGSSSAAAAFCSVAASRSGNKFFILNYTSILAHAVPVPRRQLDHRDAYTAPSEVSWPLGPSSALLPTWLSCQEYASSHCCCCIQETIVFMKPATSLSEYLQERHVICEGRRAAGQRAVLLGWIRFGLRMCLQCSRSQRVGTTINERGNAQPCWWHVRARRASNLSRPLSQHYGQVGQFVHLNKMVQLFQTHCCASRKRKTCSKTCWRCGASMP